MRECMFIGVRDYFSSDLIQVLDIKVIGYRMRCLSKWKLNMVMVWNNVRLRHNTDKIMSLCYVSWFVCVSLSPSPPDCLPPGAASPSGAPNPQSGSPWRPEEGCSLWASRKDAPEPLFQGYYVIEWRRMRWRSILEIVALQQLYSTLRNGRSLLLLWQHVWCGVVSLCETLEFNVCLVH